MSDTKKNGYNATTYFEKVCALLRVTQANDMQGRSFSIDEAGDQAAKLIFSMLGSSAKTMVIGNGGSAALASHTQNDICKAIGVPALVFTEVPILTALTNDESYDVAFEIQLNLWAKAGDLLIAISSSGRSENILRAVRAARKLHCQIITLSGFDAENPLRSMGDINFFVAGDDYGFIESSHAVILHFITDRALFYKDEMME